MTDKLCGDAVERNMILDRELADIIERAQRFGGKDDRHAYGIELYNNQWASIVSALRAAPPSSDAVALLKAALEDCVMALGRAGGNAEMPMSNPPIQDHHAQIRAAWLNANAALRASPQPSPDARAVELLLESRAFMEAMTDRFTSYAEFRFITVKIDAFLASLPAGGENKEKKCKHGKGFTEYCQPCGRING